MAKFYGSIGFAADAIETSPGVWTEGIIERTYRIDVIRNTMRHDPDGSVNENLNVSNILSIIADPFANQNIQQIRYVKWLGASWKITSVEIQRPRLILIMGGVYNG